MDWKSTENNNLIEAILSLKNADEAKRFLRDLMTEGEIEEFGKRLKTAKMLSENVSYSKIEKETGLSSATIARVSKWLNSGEGGYKKVLNTLHHHNSTKLGRGLS